MVKRMGENQNSDGELVSSDETGVSGATELGLDSDVEGADIEALARKSATEAAARGICNAPALLQKEKDIAYCSEDAKRVPWIETLLIEGISFPKTVRAVDGVKLEIAFSTTASAAVREAYRRLRIMKVPASRPRDSHAAIASDSQTHRLSKKEVDQQRRTMAVENLKQAKLTKKLLTRGQKKANAKARKRELVAERNKETGQAGNLKDRSKLDKVADEDDAIDKTGKGKSKGKKRDHEESEGASGKANNLCNQFRDSGTCKFGAACKFSHDTGGDKGKGKGTRSERKQAAKDAKVAKGKGMGKSKGKGKGDSEGHESDKTDIKKGKGKSKAKGGSPKIVDIQDVG